MPARATFAPMEAGGAAGSQGLAFEKWQGAGNDFVLLHDPGARLPAHAVELYRVLCDRHLGIGADGLIIVQPAPAGRGLAFEMLYYNADGARGSLCGNGARCAVAFAAGKGWFQGDAVHFLAADGPHEARLLPDGAVAVEMRAAGAVQAFSETEFFVDTGSPHHVALVESPAALAALDVAAEGARLRHHPRYAPGGANANFVAQGYGGELCIRTFERGVEAETLACGTGVVAAALVLAHRQGLGGAAFDYRIAARGGLLRVHREAGRALWLTGPAQYVFSGEMRSTPSS